MNSRFMSLLRTLGIPGLVLLVFFWLGFAGARWLELESPRLWLFRGGIWLLGLVAAALLFLLLRQRERARAVTPDDQIRAVVEEVERQLASTRDRGDAGGGGGGGGGKGAPPRVSARPIVLVMGPTDSAKSTLVVRSGLDAHLLSGELWRGDEVIPTTGLNAWSAGDALWIEAGGPVVESESRWASLVAQLRPASWGAALGRGAQPSRAVVLCFPLTEFFRPDARDGLVASARELGDRLSHMARELGVRLPVYVVFTKADRVPHFLAYVRAVGESEAAEAMGATLPLGGGRVGEAAASGAPASASYGEAEGQRLRHALDRLIHALSLRRLDTVRVDDDEAVRSGAYEFPRELGKLAEPLTRFLVELGRPTGLGGTPFLRGFYFTGVRPLVVADPQGGGSPSTAVPAPRAAGATGVFRAPLPQSMGAAAASGAGAGGQASGGGTRRIPQWAFLPGIIHRVIRPDDAARAVTAGGARVDLLRRALLGLGVVALAGLSLGFVVSFFGNRALVNEARVAVEGVAAVGEGGIHPAPVPELVALDSLRSLTARLREWEVEGRPRRLGFGLYRGSDLLPELRAAYFQRFERSMWARTRTDLESTLTALGAEMPEGSADEAQPPLAYGEAYDALKAHLVTTDFPQYSTGEFLSPVLLPYWTGGREVDAESGALAARQFEFYGSELPFGNPYNVTADPGRVAGARGYLGRFANADQFYQVLLAGAASEGAEAIQFHRLYPGSEAAVRSERLIPAAFTAEGWVYVQATLADVDRLFARESWVLGDRMVAPADREQLARDLQARYEDEYVSTWTAFLTDARVLAFGGVPDAASKLERLSANQSPLLQLLATASRNTDVDSGRVARAFQPVHQVTPPEVTDRFISDANQGYVQGLGGVHAAMERAAAGQGPVRTSALSEASGAVDQARMQVRELAQAFVVEPEAVPVGDAVQRLMMSPLDDAERLARAGPAAEANAQGAAFCASFESLRGAYPFNVRGATEASLDQVVAMLHPTSSQLSAFEAETLQGLIVPRGLGYGPAPGAATQPSESFLRFFTRARELSRALFTPDGQGPQVAFTLRPQATESIPEVFVTIDGQRQEVSRTSQASRTFSWEGARAGEARIEGVVQGNRVTLLASSGTWAVFRMFHRGEWEEVRPNLYQVTWRFQQPQVTLVAEVSFERGLPTFDPAFMNGLACVPRIAN